MFGVFAKNVFKGFGGATAIFTAMSLIWDYEKWKDKDYVINQLYLYFLRQLAIKMNGGREDGELHFWYELLNKDLQYKKWLKDVWPELKKKLKEEGKYKEGPPGAVSIEVAKH